MRVKIVTGPVTQVRTLWDGELAHIPNRGDIVILPDEQPGDDSWMVQHRYFDVSETPVAILMVDTTRKLYRRRQGWLVGLFRPLPTRNDYARKR